MNRFIVALQFLTRIKIAKGIQLESDSFAKSVRFFPVVGAITGTLMLAVFLLLKNILPHSEHFLVAMLILAEFMLNGILLYDGYMDTADGVFSGRERERMLEIMKDSCVGANGVIAFVLLILVKYSIYMDLNNTYLAAALLFLPALTLGLMTYNIRYYPYARAHGIGGMFVDEQEPKFTGMAVAICCLILLVYLGDFFDIHIGYRLLISTILATFVFNKIVAHNLSKQLGGLTGDTYGFLLHTDSMFFLILLNILTKIK